MLTCRRAEELLGAGEMPRQQFCLGLCEGVPRNYVAVARLDFSSPGGDLLNVHPSRSLPKVRILIPAIEPFVQSRMQSRSHLRVHVLYSAAVRAFFSHGLLI